MKLLPTHLGKSRIAIYHHGETVVAEPIFPDLALSVSRSKGVEWRGIACSRRYATKLFHGVGVISEAYMSSATSRNLQATFLSPCDSLRLHLSP